MEGKEKQLKKKKRKKRKATVSIILHLLFWIYYLPFYVYCVPGRWWLWTALFGLSWPLFSNWDQSVKDLSRTSEDMQIERSIYIISASTYSLPLLRQRDFGHGCFLLLKATEHVKQPPTHWCQYISADRGTWVPLSIQV